MVSKRDWTNKTQSAKEIIGGLFFPELLNDFTVFYYSL